ncbi:hypothetical protein E4T56_gene5409 [Termitomyces sp. T112]|nr:hypothetical protein E4T56_gene5409 [Termitomyces sp. T112]
MVSLLNGSSPRSGVPLSKGHLEGRSQQMREREWPCRAMAGLTLPVRERNNRCIECKEEKYIKNYQYILVLWARSKRMRGCTLWARGIKANGFLLLLSISKDEDADV